ncbi:AraC-like DNA-binding protein [Kutzneria viridogrisea]|uniref:HTH araC/xylS-type domain-containing protein n=2 Tax=Kutzneria TaxID=43356 RepID=W5WJF3_9PSEU|nr:helix-turn-helix transcriptional regulator [Kutzneria albida]AHI00876.1 hypothetical protein KALB_7518 [Kutzneria albida DSM 43870]MBA8926153.1 AraC-like DNA-binding protein [Kutzneria viridogrisea]
MYRERAGRAGSVLWTREVRAGEALRHRILPDGCLDLIWVDGRVLVAGPDTAAHEVSSAPGTSYVGIRFAPGTGPGVLGVPANELTDQRLDLSELWPDRAARRLAERVGDSADRGAALEQAVADRLAPPDRVLAGVVAGLRAGRPVAEVAGAVGLSERQLHRRSLAGFGYGPKTLARVLRLERALALATAGLPYAEVAASTGYADQAHLARDVKALAGVPLTILLG